MNTRFLAFLTALAAALACLSCSQPAQDAETSPAAVSDPVSTPAAEPAESETEEELTDGLEDRNFDGYDFRILSCYYNDKECADYMIYDEMTGDLINDQLYVTKQAIEDRFNVTLSVIKAGDPTACQKAFQSSVTAQDNSFDMQIGHDTRTIELALKGFCFNLYDIEQFDFSKPWWSKRTTEELTVNHKLFAASSYLSYAGINKTHILSVNKGLMEKYGIPVPYDLVREGTWVWDRFYSIVENIYSDENGNGKADRGDIFGIIGDDSYYYCMQDSFDLSAYKKDEDTIPYIDMDVEKVDVFVSKMRQMFGSGCYLDTDENYFSNGTAAFAFCQFKEVSAYYRGSDVIYGILPYPKFDENQAEYINCCVDCPWAIPVTVSAEQSEIIGTIVEAMSCMNYKTILPLFTETVLKAKLADSPDDSAMVQIIVDTRTISFAYTFNSMRFCNYIADLVANGSSTGVASYYQKSLKSAQKSLERVIEAFGG